MKALLILLGLVLSGCAQMQGGPESEDLKFTSAEPDLTKVVLKLASSLEETGKPEHYIGHVLEEQKRISDKHLKMTGQRCANPLPDYFTEEYATELIATWSALAPKLGLDSLMKKNGGYLREGLAGSWERGTIAIDLFNAHQRRVVSEGAGYSDLKAVLVKELQLDKEYHDLRGKNSAERPALTSAILIRGQFESLFEKLDESVPAAQALKIQKVILAMVDDLGQLVHAELMLGAWEKALDEKSKTGE